jgi:hypothetical protein
MSHPPAHVDTDAMPVAAPPRLTVVPLTRAVGALVTDVDLTTIDDATAA